MNYEYLTKIGLQKFALEGLGNEFKQCYEYDESLKTSPLKIIDKVVDREKYPNIRQSLTTRCLYDMKVADRTKGIIGIKIRFVPRGFLERIEEVDTINTPQSEFASPTLKTHQFKLILIYSCMIGNGILKTLDVSRAFLQSGSFPDEKKPILEFPGPESKCSVRSKIMGFFKNAALAAQVPIYGLKCAAKSWYDALVSHLNSIDFKCYRPTPAVFVKRVEANGEFTGDINSDDLVDADQINRIIFPNSIERNEMGNLCVVGTHVDDYIIAGTGSEVDKVTAGVKSQFTCGDVEDSRDGLIYTGKFIKTVEDTILIDMSAKIENLTPFVPSGISTHKQSCPSIFGDKNRIVEDYKENDLDSALNERDVTAYRGIIGVLNYILNVRPDIGFGFYSFSKGNTEKRTYRAALEINKLIAYIKNTNQLKLTYHLNTGFEDWEMIVFTDASPKSCNLMGAANNEWYRKLSGSKNVDKPIYASVTIMVPKACIPRHNSDKGFDCKCMVIDVSIKTAKESTSGSYTPEVNSAILAVDRTQGLLREYSHIVKEKKNFLLFSDSISMIKRIVCSTGIDIGSDGKNYDVLSSLQVKFGKGLFLPCFISDRSNFSDLFTKYATYTSSKFERFRNMIAGRLVIPKDDLLGRRVMLNFCGVSQNFKFHENFNNYELI